MYIVALAWIYIVLMMALANGTEISIFAGIMTFLGYCVLPLGLILYITGSPARKKKRDAEWAAANLARKQQELESRQAHSENDNQKSINLSKSDLPSDQ